MCCCGSARTSALTDWHRIRVLYGGARSVTVTGPVTGSTYRFSGASRSVLVDSRDLGMLTDWRLFRMDGVVEMTVTSGS